MIASGSAGARTNCPPCGAPARRSIRRGRDHATVSCPHACRRTRRRHPGGMPEKQTKKRAKADLRRGNKPSTAAGEFVRRWRSIASARASTALARPSKRSPSACRRRAARASRSRLRKGKAHKQDERDLAKGRAHKKPSKTRSRAAQKALKRESHSVASRSALSRQAKTAGRPRRRKKARWPARRAATIRRLRSRRPANGRACRSSTAS